ncbi:MAG TPA: VWA domain-containing protein [Thermoanaerobaculia bacterium]|jgi:VWFA-related protein|nr:VWA domain-containing protein [Thermoanaerobaculia bacterium]
MKKILAVTVLLAASTSAFAQSLTEKIDVSLVNVDVTVTSHGTPARGLTRDDFLIFEDGVAQPVSNFYSVEPPRTDGRKVATATASAPAAAVTVADPTDERFRRKVLVIVDNRHVTMYNRDRALAALERFVNDRFTGGTYDWSLALVSDSAHLILPLTSDKEKLHAAIAEVRRVVANPQHPAEEDLVRLAQLRLTQPVADTAAFRPAELNESAATMAAFSDRFQMQADAESTIAAVRDAVRSFAGAPGRKIILLVTGSLGLDNAANPLIAISSSNPRSSQSILNGTSALGGAAGGMTILRDILIHEANASNVSFYIINSEGLQAPGDASNGYSGFGDADSVGRDFDAGGASEFASMYWIARETGGRLMPGNSVERSLLEFDRTSSSFYSLAYKPPHGDDGRYHTIKVQLKRPGYQLQYRTGYSSIPAAQQLVRAMHSPLGASMQQLSIPVSIVTGAGSPHDGGVLVPLQASVAAKSLQFIPTGDGSVARVDFFFDLFDERGHEVTGGHITREAHSASGKESEGTFVDKHQLLIKPGAAYRFVVGVHDQVTDAIGIASQTIRF